MASVSDSLRRQFGPAPADTINEEDSLRELLARDPATAGQARMFGASPIVASPEENANAVLGMLPVVGNVMAAEDAYKAGGRLRDASKAGDVREQRKAMAETLLGVLGALSPLPWGRTAANAAKGAKETAYAFPAWHGSPHDFDEFKLDKIGTGEGAQVYGHGLYFAENPEVARSYQTALSPLTIDGSPIAGDMMLGTYARAKLNGALGGTRRAKLERIAHLEKAKQETANDQSRWQALDKLQAEAKDELAKIDQVQNAKVGTTGRLYQTEIDAEPHQLLDWDVRFERQSPQVQEALKQLPQTQAWLAQKQVVADLRRQIDELNSQRLTREVGEKGGELNRRLLREAHKEEQLDNAFHDYGALANSPESIATLREAGIPGIRYADQGSRGQGAGTSNYVIFDDKLVKIKGKE